MRVIKKIYAIFTSNFNGLHYIWRENKLYVILSICWPILFIPLQFFNLYTIKYITDGLVYGVELKNLLFTLGLIACFKVSQLLLENLYDKKYKTRKQECIEQNLKINFLKKVSSLDIENFDDADFYDKYVKALQEADSRYFSILNDLSSFIYSIIMLIAYSSIIINLDRILLTFAIIPVFINFLFVKKENHAVIDFGERTILIGRKVSYIMRIFYLNNYAKEIKLNRTSDFFIKKLRKYYYRYNEEFKLFTSKEFIIKVIENIIGVIIPILLQVYLIVKTKYGLLTVGSFAALETTTWQVSGYIQSVFQVIPRLEQNSKYLEYLNAILDYEPRIKNAKQPQLLNENLGHSIAIRNVSFSYPNSSNEILHNITMDIPAGAKIAIVGYNGAGKSTLVKLLMRLYDINKGEILIDGVNICDIDIASLWDNYGVVFQDFQYYAVSLAENIVFKEKDLLSDDELVDIYKSIEYAGLSEKVTKLNKNIFSPLTKEFTNEGIVLSGGELQKLALARVFMKNSSIMILDEPSSSMDPISEDNLYKNIMKIAKNKTLIFISHKLSSIKMADKIFLFEKGCIIESGSHAELMKLNGKYAEMFRIQSSYYKE